MEGSSRKIQSERNIVNPVYRYEVQHGPITVFVHDLTHTGDWKTITAFTQNGSTAELSELGSMIKIEGLNNPVYYFNRIKTRLKFEGTGEGKALMIEVCKLVDKHGITILNELNPYGKRDMESLKEFFKASDFEEIGPNVMARKPKVKGE
jgi:hypothetical protein